MLVHLEDLEADLEDLEWAEVNVMLDYQEDILIKQEDSIT